MATLTRNVNNHVMGANGWEPQTGAGGGGGGASALSQLSDVAISEPSDGQYLGYDAETGKWGNRSLPAPGVAPYELDFSSLIESGFVYVSTAQTSANLKTAVETALASGKPIAVKNLQIKRNSAATNKLFETPYVYVDIAQTSSHYHICGMADSLNLWVIQVQKSNGSTLAIQRAVGYTLPEASDTTLGGIKLGSGFFTGKGSEGDATCVAGTENIPIIDLGRNYSFTCNSASSSINASDAEDLWWALNGELSSEDKMAKLCNFTFNSKVIAGMDVQTSWSTDYDPGTEDNIETWVFAFREIIYSNDLSNAYLFRIELKSTQDSEGETTYSGTIYRKTVTAA